MNLGLLWRVGTGGNISIYQHSRVPSLEGGWRRSRMTSSSTASRYIKSKEVWNSELVSTVFFSFEAKAIVRTSIGGPRSNEGRYWKYDVHNSY